MGLLTLVAIVTCTLYVTNHSLQKHGPVPQEKSTLKPLQVTPTYTDPAAKQTGVDGVKSSDESPSSAAFPTTQPNLSVEISSYNQRANILSVKAVIEPTAKGNCSFTLSKDQVVIATKELLFSGTSCPDPTFATNDLKVDSYTLTVLVKVGDNVATSTKVIQVK